MRNFLARHEKKLCRGIQLLLCLMVLMRLGMAWRNAIFVDTRYFVETARLIMQGISPYHPEANPSGYIYPIQSPAMSLFSMPLCFTPKAFQNCFFFFGGIVAFVVFTLMVFRFYGYRLRQCMEANWKNLPVWLALAAIFISGPILLMLRHGQNSSFAALLLFAALFYPKRDHGVNVLLLGGAAAVKYSLLTGQVPVLILQRRRWFLGLCSFALFMLLVLSVGFWLEGIVPAFLDYIKLILRDAHSGANTYANPSSATFLHSSFFRNAFVNVFVKVLLLLLYSLCLYKIWRRGRQEAVSRASENYGEPSLDATEWGAFTAMSMCISYHRAYDGILFLPFLGVVFVQMWKTMRGSQGERHSVAIKLQVLVLAGLLLFWATPQSIIYAFENWLGTHFPSGQQIFVYSYHPITGYTMMFPLTKIVMLFTAGFLMVKSLADPQFPRTTAT